MNPQIITDTKQLSNALRINEESLNELSQNEYLIDDTCAKTFNLHPDSILNLKKFCIPKRNKKFGEREVYEPIAETLKNLLKVTNSGLNKVYVAPTSVHGFVKGKNIRTNATPHLEKKYLLSIDIENFFESINKEMVINCFKEYEFIESIAKVLANITTVDNKLIQGFHTSPTIANMYFKKIDLIFETVFPNLTYSRYADDLSFSSNEEITVTQVTDIIKIINDFGFSINHDKTKIMKRGRNQYVTGLTIFDGTLPRVPKRIKRKLRLQIFYINKYGYRNHILKKLGRKPHEYFKNSRVKESVDSYEDYLHNNIVGWLMYIKSIEPQFAALHLELLNNRRRD
ncbi:Reverse transcriptase (RNA-dependent DNA polymerase) [Chryseobacterium ureilyticum]|uniref:RNA-directed DNA polymerase n=1 Tax=Chryseobacterium ureilyticum TaxID=373668 RepID=A0A1N7K6W9_9FLAO|nr:reverse transcriptase family protein [Chryseobacterium ureilyticum]SIS57329.1 Reverse transcriptase (RNA-dependent DNA polymerase) [Chryseobacterium ureilyticum]